MNDWRVPGFAEVAELGLGAQGRAVLVREDATGRLGVLKYAAVHDEVVRDRFRAESVLLKQVESPFVARWYGHFEGPETAAILMEAVDGVSLRALLAEHGSMPPEAALTVLKGSLLGLAAAHALGIVHRDYKPANVVVPTQGGSKLIDFGIAGLAGERSRSGTPRYMAPEQWAGEPSSPATDVYAATCVFFECVTGEPPYSGGLSSGELAAQHRHAPIPLELLPEGVRPLVEQGMAKAPDTRPETAEAFVTRLEAVAGASYGPDWEQRGLAMLRQGALALAAFSPLALAAAVLGPGVLAQGAGGGAVAAGQAAHVAREAGRASSRAGKAWAKWFAGSKAAVAVAGAVAVGAAGTAAVVVATSGHAKPKPVPSRPGIVQLTAATTTYPTPAEPGALMTGQYIQVTGRDDQGLIAKVNAALRKPIDDQIRQEVNEYRTMAPSMDPTTRQFCKPGMAKIMSAVVTLQRPTLLAVSYYLQVGSCFHDSAGGYANIVVDLRTGASLTAADVFRPEVLTEAGVGTLLGRLTLHGTNEVCDGSYYSQPGRFLDDLRVPTNPGKVGGPVQTVLLTGSGIQIASPYEHLCGRLYWDAPYASVKDLLKPEILARI